MLPIRKSGSLFSSFPVLFDDAFSRELFNWGNSNFSSTNTTVPSLNIKEKADCFEVEMAAPGMEKADFNITLNNNLLTIESSKSSSTESNEDNFIRREFSYASFQRSIELSKNVVDDANIQASYENGLLKLHIPKKEEAKVKAPRKIEISDLQPVA
jgi:HSP20 family protein